MSELAMKKMGGGGSKDWSFDADSATGDYGQFMGYISTSKLTAGKKYTFVFKGTDATNTYPIAWLFAGISWNGSSASIINSVLTCTGSTPKFTTISSFYATVTTGILRVFVDGSSYLSSKTFDIEYCRIYEY